MDDTRFDHLTRLVARGASRRNILKGFLGLGLSAVAGNVTMGQTGARSVGVRPTIPPPPPPPTTTTTPAPTTTTVDPCTGFRCGLDCCDDPLQCCDGECCPDGAVCLTQIFAEGPSVQEETCCPIEQTCDNRCCDGECFLLGNSPIGQVFQFDAQCCPASGVVCRGDGEFADRAICCDGEAPDCCLRDGEPICINREFQCCMNTDCPDNPETCELGICRGSDQTCSLRSACEANEQCCIGQPGVPGTCRDESDCCIEADCSGECHACVDGACVDAPDLCLGDCGVCRGGTCFADDSLCSGCEICAVSDQFECIDSDDECSGDPSGSNCCNRVCEACCQDADCPGCQICAVTETGRVCIDSDDECSGNEDGSACCNGACAECCDDGDCLGCAICAFTAEGPMCFDSDDECSGNPAGSSCCNGACQESCSTTACSDANPCPGTDCHRCIDGTCQDDPDRCFGNCSRCLGGTCFAAPANCTGCQVCSFNPEENTGTCIDWNPLCPTGQSCIDGVCGIACDDDTLCPGECHTCIEGFCEVDQQKCFGDCGFCANTGVCVANAQLCAGDCQVCLFNPETNTGVCEDRDSLCPTGQVCVEGACGLPCSEQTPCPGECHTCTVGFCEIDQEKCFGDCGFCANTGVCVANAQLCAGDCQVCLFNPETNTGNCEDRDTLCPAGHTCQNGVCLIGCNEASPCPGECHTCVGGFCQIDQEKCFGDCGFCANTGVCVANAATCTGCQVCSFNPETNTGTCTNFDNLCDPVDACTPAQCENGACNQQSSCFPDASCNETNGACESALTITAANCIPDCAGKTCGSDGCTGSCGVCTDFVNSFCDDGTCSCAPATCESLDIGCGQWINDGCGIDLYCGACSVTEEPVTTPAPEGACLAEGDRCVHDNQCCAGLCRGRNCGDRGQKMCTSACTS